MDLKIELNHKTGKYEVVEYILNRRLIHKVYGSYGEALENLNRLQLFHKHFITRGD